MTTAGRPVGMAEMARLMPTQEDLIEVFSAKEAEHDDEHQGGRAAMIVIDDVS